MTIQQIRDTFEELDPDLVFPFGFDNPHSWRGVYDEPAVSPAENVTVRGMLATLDRLTSETFTGWKGGTFGPYSAKWDDLHLSREGFADEDCIGPVTLDMMVAIALKADHHV